jgi:hypothetical protein
MNSFTPYTVQYSIYNIPKTGTTKQHISYCCSDVASRRETAESRIPVSANQQIIAPETRVHPAYLIITCGDLRRSPAHFFTAYLLRIYLYIYK